VKGLTFLLTIGLEKVVQDKKSIKSFRKWCGKANVLISYLINSNNAANTGDVKKINDIHLARIVLKYQ